MRRMTLTFFIVIFFLGWCLWADQSSDIANYFTEGHGANITVAGSWGDSFGPFSAIISALGTVLLVVTLAMQRKATASQADDLYKQRFESSFFELLKLLREIRSELTFRYSPQYIVSRDINAKRDQLDVLRFSDLRLVANQTEESYFKGHSAIDAAVREYRFFIKYVSIKRTSRELFGSVYIEKMQPRVEPSFSPYFRLVYTILDRLQGDKVLNDREKYSYSRLLRSQLTSHELSLLAINATSSVAKDMFDLLIEYRMLKYHPESSLHKKLRIIYRNEAFEARD